MAVFARKASGLVRQAGLLDSTLFVMMNANIAANFWFTYLGYYTFPGCNMPISIAISAIFCVLGIALSWGMLAGSFPRSGGDYIYNSRIIHPAIGSAISWANGLFVMTAWIWILTPLVPGICIPYLAGCMGMDMWPIAEWGSSFAGLVVVSTIINFASFLVVAAGLKTFLRVQRVIMIVGIIGFAIGALILSVTPHEVFVSTWNNLATQYNSLSYSEMITATAEAGFPMPETWNWTETIGGMLVACMCMIYGYVIGYIGGEVKRPERTALFSSLFGILISGLLAFWYALGLYYTVGFKFTRAAAYVDYMWELEGYNLPSTPNPFYLASILTDNPILKFLIGFSPMMLILWIPFSYIVTSRVGFAWGMDGLGPRWFCDINPTLGSPLKLLGLQFVISEIILLVYGLVPAASFLAGVEVGVLQAVSVWGITAISAIIFPYVKKVRSVWDASPYKAWKIWGLPLITLSGIISLVFCAIITWGNYIGYGTFIASRLWTIVYIAVWICGILWYAFWRWKRAKEGIDVTLAFKELPPE